MIVFFLAMAHSGYPVQRATKRLCVFHCNKTLIKFISLFNFCTSNADSSNGVIFVIFFNLSIALCYSALLNLC